MSANSFCRPTCFCFAVTLSLLSITYVTLIYGPCPCAGRADWGRGGCDAVYIQASHALWKVQVSESERPVTCPRFTANLGRGPFAISIASPFQIGLSKAWHMFYSATDIDHIMHTYKSIVHTPSRAFDMLTTPLACITTAEVVYEVSCKQSVSTCADAFWKVNFVFTFRGCQLCVEATGGFIISHAFQLGLGKSSKCNRGNRRRKKKSSIVKAPRECTVLLTASVERIVCSCVFPPSVLKAIWHPSWSSLQN